MTIYTYGIVDADDTVDESIKGLEGDGKWKLKSRPDSSQTFMDEIMKWQDPLPKRINACPTNVEKGMAKLVLTLIELIKKLMGKQAMKRVDLGTLTDEEIETIGETFMMVS